MCYQKLEKYAEALKSYDKALELKPDFVDALNNKGYCYEDLAIKQQNKKIYKDAIKLYDEVLKIDPNNKEAEYRKKEIARNIGYL
jgi:tetratricopeptide (TPR) repeat protein